MNNGENVKAFQEALDNLLTKSYKEWDLSAMECLGVMEDAKFRILMELYHVQQSEEIN